jgi:hypothetical protein
MSGTGNLPGMEPEQPKKPPKTSGRAAPSGRRLSFDEASLVKGMLARGDRQHDIAAWFGVNSGRIIDVKHGELHPEAPVAPKEALPPPGPYATGRTAHQAMSALKLAKATLDAAQASIDATQSSINAAKATIDAALKEIGEELGAEQPAPPPSKSANAPRPARPPMQAAKKLSYIELATGRGISIESARRLARRHGWPKQVSSGGRVIVSVPVAWTKNSGSGQWLTYAEAGQRFGVSPEAARQLAKRRGWQRRTPNEPNETARIFVPGGAYIHRADGRRYAEEPVPAGLGRQNPAMVGQWALDHSA